MFHESVQHAKAAGIAVDYVNGSLPSVHKALRGKPSLIAKVALALERDNSEGMMRTFLAYVSGNPSLFDK